MYSPAYNVYKVKILQQIGGWDDSNKNAFEDYALGHKLTQLGYKIEIIPEYIYYYRIRPNSMARTYPLYDAFFRLVENSIYTSTFESYIQLSIYRYLYIYLEQISNISKHLSINPNKFNNYINSIINLDSILFKIYLKLYLIIYYIININSIIKNNYFIFKIFVKLLHKLFKR